MELELLFVSKLAEAGIVEDRRRRPRRHPQGPCSRSWSWSGVAGFTFWSLAGWEPEQRGHVGTELSTKAVDSVQLKHGLPCGSREFVSDTGPTRNSWSMVITHQLCLPTISRAEAISTVCSEQRRLVQYDRNNKVIIFGSCMQQQLGSV